MLRGPTGTTTVVDPQHLKVKELDISLTKNYCVTITIQKITSIYKFMLKACVCYFLLNFYFSPNNSSSKTKKNVFYFI